LAPLQGRRREATQEDIMKSQRAEKQGPRKQASQQVRESGRPQPDQARGREQDQERVDEEEDGFGSDEEESDR
jgi:hypothetical protein